MPTPLEALLESSLVAERIFGRLRHLDDVWGTYALDLSLDGLLEVYLATGKARFRDHVLSVMYRRNMRMDDDPGVEARPFSHLNYTIYRCVEDQRLADAFVQESRGIRARVPRSTDGLVLHPSGRGTFCVLVDFMQDYVARMARTAALTGEADFAEEAGRQVQLHRDLLRDPATGLWRQGRGWTEDDPDALAPGAWSRGQGWVLRGLTDALESMDPATPEAGLLQASLKSLIDALLPRQAGSGLWHCLVDMPLHDSAPETSGSALIATAIYRALAAGYLEGELYQRAAERAWSALSGLVAPDGRVAGVCAGPGPLNKCLLEERYARCAFPEAEDHGWFSVLYACAARETWRRVAPSGDCQPSRR